MHRDPLNWNPTAGDWTMHVPCDADNIAWVKKSLAANSPRIKVFDVDEDERGRGASEQSAAAKPERDRRGLEREVAMLATHSQTQSQAYAQTHCIVFLSDNLRNTAARGDSRERTSARTS